MQPLVRLGRLLKKSGYQFTTITPDSHARVNRRPGNERARSVRDVFGWSRAFDTSLLPPEMLQCLREANAIENVGEGLSRSTVRFSTDEDAIFVHSSFPTTAANSVFFGPDTYRYLKLLRRLKPGAKRAVDVGCGSGAGGIAIAHACDRMILTDINEIALRLAAVNAELNGVTNAETLKSDVLRDVPGPIDLVISNPPYLLDDEGRLYRDGGGRFGEALSVEIVRQSLDRLESGGRLVIYTASAIADGVDTFREAVEPLLDSHVSSLHYEELDPDVFGEELERPAYNRADRIAVVALDAVVR